MFPQHFQILRPKEEIGLNLAPRAKSAAKCEDFDSQTKTKLTTTRGKLGFDLVLPEQLFEEVAEPGLSSVTSTV